MEIDELLKRYAAGKRDFSWADLQHVDLASLDLREANFYSANLSGANLTGTNLHRANLVKARLMTAQLSQANLSQAKLYKADLSEANLTHANLKKTDLTSANLSHSDLSHANLEETILTRTCLKSATVTEAELTAAYLNQTILPDGSLHQPAADFPVKTEPLPAPRQVLSVEPENPVAPETEPPVIKTARDFWQNLPWTTLVPLWVGYFGFGLALTMQSASVWLWLLAMGSALLWVWGESLTWLMPVVGAIAVVLALPGIYTFVAILLMVLVLALTAPAILNFSSSQHAARDGLWLAGLASIWIVFCLLFFATPGGTATALLLLMGMAGSALGSMSWIKMETDGYSRQQIIETFVVTAGSGLLVSGLLLRLMV